jgi:hypothetical protein
MLIHSNCFLLVPERKRENIIFFILFYFKAMLYDVEYFIIIIWKLHCGGLVLQPSTPLATTRYVSPHYGPGVVVVPPSATAFWLDLQLNLVPQNNGAMNIGGINSIKRGRVGANRWWTTKVYNYEFCRIEHKKNMIADAANIDCQLIHFFVRCMRLQ